MLRLSRCLRRFKPPTRDLNAMFSYSDQPPIYDGGEFREKTKGTNPYLNDATATATHSQRQHQHSSDAQRFRFYAHDAAARHGSSSNASGADASSGEGLDGAAPPPPPRHANSNRKRRTRVVRSADAFPPLCREAIEKFLPPGRSNFRLEELGRWIRKLQPSFHPSNYGAAELRELTLQCTFMTKKGGEYHVVRSPHSPNKLGHDPWGYIETMHRPSFASSIPQGKQAAKWMRDF
eukprot:PhM_4_TR11526/c0_g1_i1/m.92877